jgi:hypothetical protein
MHQSYYYMQILKETERLSDQSTSNCIDLAFYVLNTVTLVVTTSLQDTKLVFNVRLHQSTIDKLRVISDRHNLPTPPICFYQVLAIYVKHLLKEKTPKCASL